MFGHLGLLLGWMDGWDELIENTHRFGNAAMAAILYSCRRRDVVAAAAIPFLRNKKKKKKNAER